MSSSDITALGNWVLEGNVLIVSADSNARAVTLLNGVFGWSLSYGTSSQSTSTLTSEAADTVFASGPSTLTGPNGNYALTASSIPSDGASIYTYVSVSYECGCVICAVSYIPVLPYNLSQHCGHPSCIVPVLSLRTTTSSSPLPLPLYTHTGTTATRTWRTCRMEGV